MDIARPQSPYDAPQILDRDTDSHSAVANTQLDEACIRSQPTSIDQVVHIFLKNMRQRFGEHSPQVYTINRTLSAFRNARVSKRDAMSSINLALGTQTDLKQDLMNVLLHEDARWGAEDFDFEIVQPVAKAVPQFLQPDHQPQLRLPSINSSWNPGHQPVQTINPAVLDSNGGLHKPEHQGYHEPNYVDSTDRNFQSLMQPPPFLASQMPPRLPLPNQPPARAMTYATKVSPYSHPAYEHIRVMSQQGPGNKIHQNGVQYIWREAENYGEYTVNSKGLRPSSDQSNETRHGQLLASSCTQSHMPSHTVWAPHLVSPHRVGVFETPSVLGTPVAVPIGGPVVNMSPLSKQRHHHVLVALTKERECHKEERDVYDGTLPLERTGMTRLLDKETSTEPTRRRSEQQGTFVHSLCGKAFTSRSGVKKHHWGGKNNNPETTTGCWVKCGKPNTSWDEHSSCKESVTVPGTGRKPSAKTPKQELGSKTPIIPAISSVPRRSILPRFPTLQHLPQIVAEAVAPRTQSTFPDVGLYHSYGRSTQPRSEDMFTAVGIAPKIAAPQAQGRNDSVVSQLDAQVVAAERNRQFVASWVDGFQAHQEEGAALERPSSAHDGLTLSFPLQFPRGMTLLSQMQKNNDSASAATAILSHKDAARPSDRTSAWSRSSASPSPESKRRRL